MSVTQLPVAAAIPPPTPRSTWRKRVRRTATAVLAGEFDERPVRDALTSLLNGVPQYKAEWETEWEKQEKLKEKKEKLKQKPRKKERTQPAPSSSSRSTKPTHSVSVTPSRKSESVAPITSITVHNHGRPTIHIPSVMRMPSITPPPASPIPLSTPASTPGPASSSTSRTSSKRPHTPDDFDMVMVSSLPRPPPPKKKRVAVKKGWKGWVEGSPEPSDKLINLDDVPIIQERKTRSGKSFDAY